MQIRFGNIFELKKYRCIKSPSEKSIGEYIVIPLAERLQTAEKMAAQIRAKGGKAEVLAYNWLNSIYPHEPDTTFFHFATSSGQPNPTDVFVFEGVDAGTLRYVKQVQALIDDVGTEGLPGEAILPVQNTKAHGGYPSFLFDIREALQTLEDLRRKPKLKRFSEWKPSVISEMMRTIFYQCAIDSEEELQEQLKKPGIT